MKKLIFYIHSTAGLLSGLFILLMSISGAALVFHEDIDHLQQPEFSVKDYNNLSVDSAYNNLRQRFPYAQINSCAIPQDKETVFAFSVNDPSYTKGKKAMQMFLHPQTGSYLGSRGGSEDMKHNFMSWLSKFHNSFHLGKKGEWLLGFFSLVFLISIITGFILFRKNILAVFLFKKAAYKGNLHQVIGTWVLVFNLMIAVTGFWMQRYVFKKEFYQSYDYTPVVKASPPLSFNFDSAYNKVIKKQYPDFTAAVIYFAQSSSKTAVYGSRASNAYIHSKKFADVIMLDSAGGIAKTRMINENSPGDKYDIINSQLHMGKYGGWGIKIIYFVFGLTGALLSITGFLVWWRRRRKNELPESR